MPAVCLPVLRTSELGTTCSGYSLDRADRVQPCRAEPMSLDLAWNKLDAALADRIIETINNHLSTIDRPSFIGPVEVTAVDFGTVCPDVELVDMRDIYRDFLEDDEDDESHNNTNTGTGTGLDPVKVTEHLTSSTSAVASGSGLSASASASASIAPSASASTVFRNRFANRVDEDEDDYEWISRRGARRGLAQEAPAYHHLPPHLRYGSPPPPPGEFLAALPGMGIHAGSQRELWRTSISSASSTVPGTAATTTGIGRMGVGVGMGMSLPNLAEMRRPGPTPLQPAAYTGRLTEDAPTMSSEAVEEDTSLLSSREPPESQEEGKMSGLTTGTPPFPPAENPNRHPNLQLHFRVLYHSDMKLSIITSLLINYPSQMFMSLPIKLSVTGFVFNGEVAVAYEGQRRRVHFCILDDLDPYCPIGDRSKKDSLSSDTPPDVEDSPPSKPLPIGQRLLPSIFIESEIGQADKHVLRNVTRVERFIQDVIRKTVEDELVFPNFHTLILGD